MAEADKSIGVEDESGQASGGLSAADALALRAGIAERAADEQRKRQSGNGARAGGAGGRLSQTIHCWLFRSRRLAESRHGAGISVIVARALCAGLRRRDRLAKHLVLEISINSH